MDFSVENHGSIFLVHPLTDAAREWISENVAPDSQFWGRALAVEHRFIGDLVRGARADGLVIR